MQYYLIGLNYNLFNRTIMLLLFLLLNMLTNVKVMIMLYLWMISKFWLIRGCFRIWGIWWANGGGRDWRGSFCMEDWLSEKTRTNK